jgi:hypothetical protein
MELIKSFVCVLPVPAWYKAFTRRWVYQRAALCISEVATRQSSTPGINSGRPVDKVYRVPKVSKQSATTI